MKKLLIASLACAALLPAAAGAKERIGEAKVVYTPVPAGLRAGQPWNIRFHFLFHDGKPWQISGLRPWFGIAQGRVVKTFRAWQFDSGTYAARVVFPKAGTWAVTFHFGPEVPAGARRLHAVTVS